jgi:diguanylate cyclase (GGDEF)-like protein
MRVGAPRWRLWLWLAWAWLWIAPAAAWAAEAGQPRMQQWLDPTGRAGIGQVASGAAFEPLDRPRAVALGSGALWLRIELPAAAHEPLYLMLTGAAFLNRASLFTPVPGGGWREQRAGDQVPVAQWTHPNFAPLFDVPAAGGTAWLRLENRPAPVSPHLRLLSARELQATRQWTHFLVGAYLGFGVLVALLALMQGRLAADLAFHSYAVYVGCMLLFQLAFTGVGAVFLWPGSARFNDAAPALSMLLMTAAGIWNIRNATALQRHGRRIDRAVLAFALAGVALIAPHLVLGNAATYALLNLYGLAAVALSMGVCLWTWRRGEPYSLWLFFGFLPVHLAYPFPALRAAGVLPDSWATQYAVLIGSAIEIPLVLYVLHRRARDSSEHRGRLRALESTDPLTGLVLPPVLQLRLRDALRRGDRFGHRCALLLVDLANHGQIAAREGRAAAERALVVAASRLATVVRDVDTVCRVSDTRFAVLIEGPCEEGARHRLAQHMVARGLERVPTLPPDVDLRFRIVSASVPDGTLEVGPAATPDHEAVLQRLGRVLDELLQDPRRVIQHLGPREAHAVPAARA